MTSRSASASRAEIFLSVFGEDTLEFLRVSVERTACATKHKYAKEWAPHHILSVFAFLIRLLANGTPDMDKHARSVRPGEVSANRIEGFRALLEFDVLTLFDLLNRNMSSVVTVQTSLCLDESIWPWDSDHYAVVYIPRKPNSDGIKTFTLCVVLTHSQRPYCVEIVPDISQPRFTAAVAMDRAVTVARRLNAPEVTADSWFGQLNSLHSYHPIRVTVAISAQRGAEILPIFEHNLPVGRFRVFERQGTYLSLWHDSALHIVASTRFRHTEDRVTPVTVIGGLDRENAPSLNAAFPVLPRFSASFADLLQNDPRVSSEDLSLLAQAFGEKRGAPTLGHGDLTSFFRRISG